MSSETAILMRFTAGAAKQILSGNKEIAYNGTSSNDTKQEE